jgi:autoinducer 2-degrading protein
LTLADEFRAGVNCRIKAGQVDKLMKELLGNAKAARETEPGCLQFDVLVDPKDPAKLMLYEVYKDEAAFEAHQQAPHFKRYLEQGVPLLESRERTVYRRTAP